MSRKLKFILPVPISPGASERFAAQIPESIRRAGTAIDFVGCRAGSGLMDSEYDATIADALVLAVGARAEAEGYAAVCSFSMSDSGLAALRSRLTIPVIGTAQASFALALQLGRTVSVVTMWAPWARRLKENAARYGFAPRVASIRHIDVAPDTQYLLAGKEEMVFERLRQEALRAIEQDGAEAIILGSTTMYQAHAFLAQCLPCPVINPGLAAYQACETVLDLKLTHSKLTHPSPANVADHLFDPIPPAFDAA